MGPISIALFAPGDDFNVTMNGIQYARHCLPISDLIRDFVSFHIYFPNDHMPSVKVPNTEEEALEWPHDCTAVFAPYELIPRSKVYWRWRGLDFPINVGRNVARKAVNTHFILNSDIELYPSMGFIEEFLRMISNNENLILNGHGRRVFALPVFDLDQHAIVPDNKEELMTMYDMEMALPMHQESCSYCILVPDEDKWLQADNKSDRMEVISVTKRYTNEEFWEPFYVSDNTEPEYDDRLAWELHSDKRLHNYAMCLLDYEYYILHPAFLTHEPSRRKNFDTDGERMDYVEEAVLDILQEYHVLYGDNNNCVV